MSIAGSIHSIQKDAYKHICLTELLNILISSEEREGTLLLNDSLYKEITWLKWSFREVLKL